jgi:protein TonB
MIFSNKNRDIIRQNDTVVKKPDELNIILVEQVPIFLGCEDAMSNDARRQCMSEKMS